MNTLVIIILLLLILVGIPWWWKKRKEKRDHQSISTRHEKDEVWRTIKQYLKDSDDYGKEIIDSYVAKRNPIDYINPNLPHSVKVNKKYINKIRTLQINASKRLAKKNGTAPDFDTPKVRDLYVVCFLTKSIKTGKIDAPRAFECEVINTKISKKDWDRKIVINGALNYDKEMEWIAPIRTAEEIKSKKADEIAAKKAAKEKAKIAKHNKKQAAKVAKKKAKQN